MHPDSSSPQILFKHRSSLPSRLLPSKTSNSLSETRIQR